MTRNNQLAGRNSRPTLQSSTTLLDPRPPGMGSVQREVLSPLYTPSIIGRGSTTAGLSTTQLDALDDRLFRSSASINGASNEQVDSVRQHAQLATARALRTDVLVSNLEEACAQLLAHIPYGREASQQDSSALRMLLEAGHTVEQAVARVVSLTPLQVEDLGHSLLTGPWPARQSYASNYEAYSGTLLQPSAAESAPSGVDTPMSGVGSTNAYEALQAMRSLVTPAAFSQMVNLLEQEDTSNVLAQAAARLEEAQHREEEARSHALEQAAARLEEEAAVRFEEKQRRDEDALRHRNLAAAMHLAATLPQVYARSVATRLVTAAAGAGEDPSTLLDDYRLTLSAHLAHPAGMIDLQECYRSTLEFKALGGCATYAIAWRAAVSSHAQRLALLPAAAPPLRRSPSAPNVSQPPVHSSLMLPASLHPAGASARTSFAAAPLQGVGARSGPLAPQGQPAGGGLDWRAGAPGGVLPSGALYPRVPDPLPHLDRMQTAQDRMQTALHFFGSDPLAISPELKRLILGQSDGVSLPDGGRDGFGGGTDQAREVAEQARRTQAIAEAASSALPDPHAYVNYLDMLTPEQLQTVDGMCSGSDYAHYTPPQVYGVRQLAAKLLVSQQAAYGVPGVPYRPETGHCHSEGVNIPVPAVSTPAPAGSPPPPPPNLPPRPTPAAPGTPPPPAALGGIVSLAPATNSPHSPSRYALYETLADELGMSLEALTATPLWYGPPPTATSSLLDMSAVLAPQQEFASLLLQAHRQEMRARDRTAIAKTDRVQVTGLEGFFRRTRDAAGRREYATHRGVLIERLGELFVFNLLDKGSVSSSVRELMQRVEAATKVITTWDAGQRTVLQLRSMECTGHDAIVHTLREIDHHFLGGGSGGAREFYSIKWEAGMTAHDLLSRLQAAGLSHHVSETDIVKQWITLVQTTADEAGNEQARGHAGNVADRFCQDAPGWSLETLRTRIDSTHGDRLAGRVLLPGPAPRRLQLPVAVNAGGVCDASQMDAALAEARAAGHASGHAIAVAAMAAQTAAAEAAAIQQSAAASAAASQASASAAMVAEAAAAAAAAYAQEQKDSSKPPKRARVRGALKNLPVIFREGKVKGLRGKTLAPPWNVQRADGMYGCHAGGCPWCSELEKQCLAELAAGNEPDITMDAFKVRFGGAPSPDNQRREVCIVHFQEECYHVKLAVIKHCETPECSAEEKLKYLEVYTFEEWNVEKAVRRRTAAEAAG